jgi:hypothetical protein
MARQQVAYPGTLAFLTGKENAISPGPPGIGKLRKRQGQVGE